MSRNTRTRARSPASMHSGAQPLAYSIIAIGASAGGLQAIGDILAKLPPTLACPVLVVIHLAPQFTSHAAAVLARNTSLHVTQARQDEVLRPGVVYIAPPDFHLNVENGAVRLTRSAVIHFSRPSVDSMLESVASNYGKRAIAVILTGSGSDGAEGLRAIKAAGGFTIVQDPNGAQFPAMPGAAVATHCADRVLPLGEIGALLNELGAKPGTMHAQ